MSIIPGDAGQKAILTDGLQVDHISENTVGHGSRVRGISDPTTYGVIAGDVGERISSFVSSPVTINTSTYTNVTSVTLTAGVWDLCAMLAIAGAVGVITVWFGITATSQGSVALADSGYSAVPASNTGYSYTGSIPGYRVSLTTSTTYYLTAISFGAGTTVNGRLTAVRVS
jgi:hypothetical protein